MRRRLWICCFTLVLSACSSTRDVPIDDAKRNLSRLQFVFHADFELPDRYSLVEELDSVGDDLHRELGLPVSEAWVQVYLFESEEHYLEYLQTRHPRLPSRRSFFVATEDELVIYAQWSAHVLEDLRHEISHVYLHTMVGTTPIWLDEGLAEYFEATGGFRGRHRGHVNLLTRLYDRGDWSPDLRRLEQMQKPEEMTLLDYAESWLWIHLLMETAPDRSQWLRRYLVELQNQQRVRPLSKRTPKSERPLKRSLIQHLKWLAHHPLRCSATSRGSR